MKTTRYLLSLGMLALTTVNIAQFASIADRIFPDRTNQFYYTIADYEINKISRIDAVYEEEQGLENWMTAPFGSALVEEAVEIESWMTAPFGSALVEEAVEIESWMTAPFGSALLEVQYSTL